MKESPIALHTNKANEQHYELPSSFFSEILGPYLKYSACIWPSKTHSLVDAEKFTLDLTCRRAELKDGMNILELGCGWGALTIWMAEHFPASRITAVSNSSSQRSFILSKAKMQNLENIRVITADMNNFQPSEKFDRIVSLEMFEHMRNYRLLLHRISNWLTPKGKLFIHIFNHREIAYPFKIQGSLDWMSKYFFTGGIMPSDHLLLYFQDDLKIEKHWRVNGMHYSKTLESWLKNLDSKHDHLTKVIGKVYGDEFKELWFMRWRLFFMACSELFAYHNGTEWFVSHYLFSLPTKKGNQ